MDRGLVRKQQADPVRHRGPGGGQYRLPLGTSLVRGCGRDLCSACRLGRLGAAMQRWSRMALIGAFAEVVGMYAPAWQGWGRPNRGISSVYKDCP